MFADHYFYLIAFKTDDDPDKPFYFRVDRIKRIVEHRKTFENENLFTVSFLVGYEAGVYAAIMLPNYFKNSI